jgi:DNA-binding PadR family transcriptional regulator
MDIKMYMLNLLKFQNIYTKIGDAALRILHYFVLRKYSSTYQIYSELKKSPSRMAYKNVHKRVQRLEALQLIQRLEVKDAQHGAKYYRLTEAGIYHLFLHFSHPSFVFDFPRIVENYGDFAFFDLFLYRYFKRDTLMSINRLTRKPVVVKDLFEDFNVKLTSAVVAHLRVCCSAVQSFFSKLDKEVQQPTDQGLSEDLHRLDIEILSRSYFLLFTIICCLAEEEEETAFNTIRTISLDNKFMRNVDDLYATFKKGYNKCMDIRQKS